MMVVAFLGDSTFEKTDKEKTCMMFTVFPAAMGEVTDFYFTGDSAFNDYAYEWCKKYQRDTPKSRLIYVVADEDSPKTLKKKKRKYDLVVSPQISEPKAPGISVQEQYMIEKSHALIIYRDGGLDNYRPAFYAILRDKRVSDYYYVRNELIYTVRDRMSITIREMAEFEKEPRSPDFFVSNMLLYLHINKDLMKEPEYQVVYDSGVLFFIKRFHCFKNYVSYNFDRCKKYIAEELDILAEKYIKAKKTPITDEEFAFFCEYHSEILSKRAINQEIFE